MASQRLKITRITKKDYDPKQPRKEIVAINRASIGYITINGITYGYNLELLDTSYVNLINFTSSGYTLSKPTINITRK